MKDLKFVFALLIFLHVSAFAQIQMGQTILGTGNAEYWFSDISDDGNRIIVMDAFEPELSIYDWNGVTWRLSGKLLTDDPGSSGISISGDGNVIAVYRWGSIIVFHWNGGSWEQRGLEIDADAFNVEVIDLSYDGTHLGYKSSDNEFNVVFWNGTQWEDFGQTIIFPNGWINEASSIAISGTGTTLVIGCPRCNLSKGEVYVFSYINNEWRNKGNKLTPNNSWSPHWVGASVSVSNDGNIIGVSLISSVQIFEWNGQDWSEKGQELRLPGSPKVQLDHSGSIMAISEPDHTDFNREKVQRGQIMLMKFNGNRWVEVGYPVVGPNEFGAFGMKMAFSKNGKVVIATGLSDDGKLYLKAFRFEGIGYQPATYVSSSDSECDYARKLERVKYSILADSNKYEISPDIDYPIYLPIVDSILVFPTSFESYYHALPESVTYYRPTLEGVTLSGTLKDTFCLVPGDTAIHNVKVDIVLPDQSRPGRVTNVRLVYSNIGTSIRSGTVSLFFDGNVQSVNGSEPLYDGQNINTLTWTYQDLLPFEQRVIDVEFELNRPTDDPPLNGDDILSYSARIEPTMDDVDLNNNYVEAFTSVVNAFDPNDKRCMQGDTLSPQSVGKRLTYIIRFENVGNAEAIDVRIRDVIDTTRLDISSFEFLESTHDPLIRITEGNIVDFIFQDINLPFEDEFNDGYVAFSINSKKNLLIGDEIVNRAGIYFDFNYPVITNDAKTIVKENITNVYLQSKLFQVEIFPNPVNESFQWSSGEPIRRMSIFTADGRIVKELVFPGQGLISGQVNMDNLPGGLYMLHLLGQQNSQSLQIVKRR